MASAISLLLCIAIAIVGLIYMPGQFRGIYFGDGTWGATVGNGIISPCHANRIIASVPVSALALPFAIQPLVWCWRTWRREQRRKRGRCTVCGYDLRASADRCPECNWRKAEGDANESLGGVCGGGLIQGPTRRFADEFCCSGQRYSGSAGQTAFGADPHA